jgi:AraC-like DNA-binding protein
MPSQALLAPPAVFQLAPPYERFEAVADFHTLPPEDLPRAALIAVGVSAPEAWGEVATLVPELRERYPAAPLVLLVGPRTGAGEFEWVRRAGSLRVRAVLFDGEPPRPTLRRILTDATGLPEDVEQWVTVRVPGLPPAVVRLVGEIVRLSPRFSEIGALLESLGHAERTVRTWFRRARVPGPGKWLAASHAVRASLRMQADESAPLLALAVECGYSDHSSLSRQCLRLFGVRPGAIRPTLGWEWLLDRWLRRVAP